MIAFKKKWIFLPALIPIVIYFGWLNCYGINIPLFDDHAFKEFLLQWNKPDSILQKLQLLFSQHNEHRIAYTRIVILAIYGLTGQLNYVYLMWVGNWALLGILLVLYKAIYLEKPNPNLYLSYAIIPLSLVLFTLQHHENTFWGMASIQNFGVVFWSLFCFYLLARQRFIAAMIVGFVATFSSGNGFLVLAIATLLFLLQKQYRRLIQWIVFSILLSVFYFYDYTKPPGNPAEASWGQGFQVINGFLVLVGGAFDVSFQTAEKERIWVSILAGIIIFLPLLWLLFKELIRWLSIKKLDEWQLFWVGASLFVMGTLGITVITRLGFGESLLLTSRYKIYSVVLVMLVFTAFIRQVNQPKFVIMAFSLISLIYAGFVYFQQQNEVVFHRNYLIASQFNSRSEPKNPIVPYQKPHTPLDNQWTKKLLTTPLIDTLYKVNQEWVVLNQNLEIGSGLNDAAFILLTSATTQIMFPVRQNRNLSKRNLLQTFQYYSKGFIGTFSEKEVPNGNYSLSIVECKAGKTTFTPTDRTIEVQLKYRKELLKNW